MEDSLASKWRRTLRLSESHVRDGDVPREIPSCRPIPKTVDVRDLLRACCGLFVFDESLFSDKGDFKAIERERHASRPLTPLIPVRRSIRFGARPS